jgi:hypothetical protein
VNHRKVALLTALSVGGLVIATASAESPGARRSAVSSSIVIGTRQLFRVTGTNIACETYPERGGAAIGCALFHHGALVPGSYGFLFDEVSVDVVRVTSRGTTRSVFLRSRPRPYSAGSVAPAASSSRREFTLAMGGVVLIAKTDIACAAGSQGPVYHGARGTGTRGIACFISASPPAGTNVSPVGNTLIPTLGTTVFFVQRINAAGRISVAFFHRQPSS